MDDMFLKLFIWSLKVLDREFNSLHPTVYIFEFLDVAIVSSLF